jgi:hypothetical protein
MSVSAGDASHLSAKIELLEQRSSKQLAAVTDELVLIKQQLAQLLQSLGAANSTTATCERLPAVHNDVDALSLSQQQQHEHRHQRARVSHDQIPVLARDEQCLALLALVITTM